MRRTHLKTPISPPAITRVTASAPTAFSLIEVTLAVGIVFIAIVTMLGIMPVGLSTMRDARDATIRAQIAQRITSEALVLPFTKLSGLLDKTYYFDNEGFQQMEKNGATRFEVFLEKANAIYPGSSTADQLEQSITSLKVHVQLSTAAEPPSTYVVLIPNRGG